jgi:hypothetical protein
LFLFLLAYDLQEIEDSNCVGFSPKTSFQVLDDTVRTLIIVIAIHWRANGIIDFFNNHNLFSLLHSFFSTNWIFEFADPTALENTWTAWPKSTRHP